MDHSPAEDIYKMVGFGDAVMQGQTALTPGQVEHEDRTKGIGRRGSS